MILIKTNGTGAGIPKRQLNQMLRSGFEELGVKWHREYRPLHFTNQASTRYNYQPRQGERGSNVPFRSKNRLSYTARKLRNYGHTKPLVLTGESEQLTRIRNVTATSKGCRVRMNAPTLNFRPHMREELTRMIDSEREALTKTLDDHIDSELEKIK